MSKNKSKIVEKINFLIDFAISEKNKNNPYIYDYIKISFSLAKKINYRFPSNIHRKVCKNCFSLRDSNNTLIRIEKRKVSKNLRKYIKLHCLSCSYIKKIKI